MLKYVGLKPNNHSSNDNTKKNKQNDTYYGHLSSEKMNFCCMHAYSFKLRVDHCIANAPSPLLRALFISSWLILSSIKNCACVIELGLPVMVTIRLRVPGAKMPFFDIWMLAPLICWISTKERPPGPERDKTMKCSFNVEFHIL